MVDVVYTTPLSFTSLPRMHRSSCWQFLLLLAGVTSSHHMSTVQDIQNLACRSFRHDYSITRPEQKILINGQFQFSCSIGLENVTFVIIFVRLSTSYKFYNTWLRISRLVSSATFAVFNGTSGKCSIIKTSPSISKCSISIFWQLFGR